MCSRKIPIWLPRFGGGGELVPVLATELPPMEDSNYIVYISRRLKTMFYISPDGLRFGSRHSDIAVDFMAGVVAFRTIPSRATRRRFVRFLWGISCLPDAPNTLVWPWRPRNERDTFVFP